MSMYNDDGDDEMEDVEEEEEEGMLVEQHEDAAGHDEFDLAADTDRMAVADSGNDVGSTPAEKSRLGASTPQANMFVSPPLEQRTRRSGTLTIVDYGHDEVAMSPEPEVYILLPH